MTTFLLRGIRCSRVTSPDGSTLVTPLEGPHWRFYCPPGKPFSYAELGAAIDAIEAAERAGRVFERAGEK